MSPVIHNKPTERRSGIDRRQFSYALHIPERRNREDRRRKLPKRLQEAVPVAAETSPISVLHT